MTSRPAGVHAPRTRSLIPRRLALSLLGMQRRVYTYPADAGLSNLNMISTVGAFAMAVGVDLFVLNFVDQHGRRSARRR